MMGLVRPSRSTRGNISFCTALEAGYWRVPRPAAVMTALRTLGMPKLSAFAQVPARRSRFRSDANSLRFRVAQRDKCVRVAPLPFREGPRAVDDHVRAVVDGDCIPYERLPRRPFEQV